MTDVLPAHSPLGASSHYRWKACPGSVRLCKGIKSVSSVYAEAGTRAHEVASNILEGKQSVAIDKDDMDAVLVYVKFVREIQKAYAPVETFIETKFNLSDYYPGLYGTADCVIYSPHNKELFVIDYKHGQGVAVEAKDNSQLMYYGLGALHAYDFPVSKVSLIIVQPRCYHPDGPVRLINMEPSDLLDFAADLIVDATSTEDLKAPLNPGDHCRWCPAQATCPAIHAKALAVAQNVFSSVATYDGAKLGETLDFLPAMETWIKSVREFAYREAQAGRTPPGWKLVEKRANRKFAVTSEEWDTSMVAQALCLDEDHMFERKLKSVAQIEKIASKAALAKLGALITKESSGYTLVSEKDNRARVPDAIEAAFGRIE